MEMARAYFTPIRVDRDSNRQLTTRFNINRKYPTLVLTDCEGVETTRFIVSINPSDFVAAMRQCLRLSGRKIRAGEEVSRLFRRVDTAMEEENYKFATSLLRRILRTRSAPVSAVTRANEGLEEITSLGERLYREALAEEDAEIRLAKLRELRREFGQCKDLVSRIRSQITALSAASTG